MLLNMKDLLKVANENNFAVPAFNVSDYSMFIGIMDSCERTDSPVIIEIHPLELDFTGTDLVEAIIGRAWRSPVPVCLIWITATITERSFTPSGRDLPL